MNRDPSSIVLIDLNDLLPILLSSSLIIISLLFHIFSRLYLLIKTCDMYLSLGILLSVINFVSSIVLHITEFSSSFWLSNTPLVSVLWVSYLLTCYKAPKPFFIGHCEMCHKKHGMQISLYYSVVMIWCMYQRMV